MAVTDYGENDPIALEEEIIGLQFKLKEMEESIKQMNNKKEAISKLKQLEELHDKLLLLHQNKLNNEELAVTKEQYNVKVLQEKRNVMGSHIETEDEQRQVKLKYLQKKEVSLLEDLDMLEKRKFLIESQHELEEASVRQLEEEEKQVEGYLLEAFKQLARAKLLKSIVPKLKQD